MSVNFCARIIRGWVISEEDYGRLVDDDKFEKYAMMQNGYCGCGYCFFAEQVESTEEVVTLDPEDLANGSDEDVVIESQLMQDYCEFMGIPYGYDNSLLQYPHTFLMLGVM